jgi:hypothetical protein
MKTVLTANLPLHALHTNGIDSKSAVTCVTYKWY